MAGSTENLLRLWKLVHAPPDYISEVDSWIAEMQSVMSRYRRSLKAEQRKLKAE